MGGVGQSGVGDLLSKVNEVGESQRVQACKTGGSMGASFDC